MVGWLLGGVALALGVGLWLRQRAQARVLEAAARADALDGPTARPPQIWSTRVVGGFTVREGQSQGELDADDWSEVITHTFIEVEFPEASRPLKSSAPPIGSGRARLRQAAMGGWTQIHSEAVRVEQTARFSDDGRHEAVGRAIEMVIALTAADDEQAGASLLAWARVCPPIEDAHALAFDPSSTGALGRLLDCLPETRAAAEALAHLPAHAPAPLHAKAALRADDVEALTRVVGERSLSGALRARALARVVDRLAADRRHALVLEALASEHPGLIRAAAERASGVPHAALVPAVERAWNVPDVDRGPLLIAMATLGPAVAEPSLRTALGDESDAVRQTALNLGHRLGLIPALESRLCSLLDDPHEAVRVDAISALERHGTVAAVGALRALAERDDALEWRVEHAIEAIQARVGGAAGGLSLSAPTTEGAVSLAPDTRR